MVEVLDLLSRVQATLHINDGRISGQLYTPHPSWTVVKFRGAKGETIEDTLLRAIKELHRRQLEGMPRTSQTAPCGGCHVTRELRYIHGVRQWLCADCRRGLRQAAEERRRSRRRRLAEGRL